MELILEEEKTPQMLKLSRICNSRVHTYIQLERVRFNAYLACCPGGGLRAWSSARTQSTPPVLLAVKEWAKSEESGWWRDAGNSRNVR